MKTNYGRWYSQSTGTHAPPQMFVLFPILTMTHLSSDPRRLYASTSSTLLNHRSAQACRLRIISDLRVHARFGWFWECPNGGEKCQYRHALPPGFVLRSERKALEDAEKANTISLEEFLEVEVRIETSPLQSVISGTKTLIVFPQRHKLGQNLTPVTPDSFAKWKRTRMDRKQAEEEAVKKAKEATHAAGKNKGMSGRDLVRLVSSDPYPSALSLFPPVPALDREFNLIALFEFFLPTVHVQPRVVRRFGRRGGRGLGFGTIPETKGRRGRCGGGGEDSTASVAGRRRAVFSLSSCPSFSLVQPRRGYLRSCRT